jgi:hypothetical protein
MGAGANRPRPWAAGILQCEYGDADHTRLRATRLESSPSQTWEASMQMRWPVSIVLAVILAAAVGGWLRFSPSQVDPNVSGAAEASSIGLPP